MDDVGCAVDPTILPDLTYMSLHDDGQHENAVIKVPFTIIYPFL